MDIRYLTYFIAIVHNGFNISDAANGLFITQSALSKCVKYLEDNFSPLFVRSKGRLVGLTVAGECMYKNAIILTQHYETFLTELETCSLFNSNSLTIGIPPFVISALFNSILRNLHIKYPHIELTIVEFAGEKLSELLYKGELDIAILLEPSNPDPDLFEYISLYTEELNVYMSVNHPLTEHSTLQWNHLNDQVISLVDQSYRLHHLIMDKLKLESINVKDYFLTSQWDLAISVVKNTEMITIMPNMISKIIISNELQFRPIENPLFWTIKLVHSKKNVKKSVAMIKNFIVEQF